MQTRLILWFPLLVGALATALPFALPALLDLLFRVTGRGALLAVVPGHEIVTEAFRVANLLAGASFAAMVLVDVDRGRPAEKTTASPVLITRRRGDFCSPPAR